MWFIFAIISSGAHNGWTKLGTFSKCVNDVNKNGSNSFGFSKFLTVMEIFMYYIAMTLGTLVLHKIK